MNPPDYPIQSAAVVITTKNRVDDLRRAVASALAQTAKPEVLVIDDGSTDETFRVMATEFPEVSLMRSEESRGYIAQRNFAADLTFASVIVSIDDDAIFSTDYVVEKTLEDFNHPRVGAVAIPFINVHQSPEVLQKAPESRGIHATYSFIGTAHAVRRDLFLRLGRYREFLVHQGEEEDFCTRMLDAGYITKCGNADPIHHTESPRRSWERMDFYGARNKILYAWANVPMPYLPGHLAVTSAKAMAHNLNPGRFRVRARGIWNGYTTALERRDERRPIRRQTYLLSRALKRQGSIELSAIENSLPPLALKRKHQPLALASP